MLAFLDVIWLGSFFSALVVLTQVSEFKRLAIDVSCTPANTYRMHATCRSADRMHTHTPHAYAP